MELDTSRSALRGFRRLPVFGAVARLTAELRTPARATGRLLVVGTATYEPWHLVAHLQRSPLAEYAPTLVRFAVPVGAPAHLSVALSRLAAATRGDSVLVVAPDDAGPDLLERLADARRRGGTVLAMAGQQRPDAIAELGAVCHDTALVRSDQLELAQHLLPVAASGRAGRRTGGAETRA